MMKQLTIFITILLVLGCKTNEKRIYTEEDIKIIPKPEMVKINPGVFEFNENTKFFISNDISKEPIHVLKDNFKTVAGWDLIITEEQPKKNYVAFTIDKTSKPETYDLKVDNNHIEITASSPSGFSYAIQTIRQLLPPKIDSKTKLENRTWEIPNVEIKDGPRFKWRGLMLDISRHFFDKEYIKEVIDGLAMHKMNVLHLHLVDDQGWRIEIKKYPKLTKVGAWRVDQESLHWNARLPVKPEDKGTYGGFLTQEELKEIVTYAQSRNVEVIPEIEMPAHISSAIAAYPHLSCFEKPIGVPSGGVWPITDIYCAGKESTFTFLEDVLVEVMEIFPSKYIHIGGDEATKTNWKKCQHCQKRIAEEGLQNEEELQSYFVKRMEKFINSHGKKLVGWDEILEGGLAPDATVMSWRGVKGGLEAAAQGHDVVMTPGTHCYFDHYQGPQNEEPLAIGGYTPLSKVYQFDPIVDSMTAEEAEHVLGGQANLWSEYIPTKEHSQYMIYPRLAALSEAVWSAKNQKDWDDFSNRMINMFQRYEFLGINYAKSSYLIRPEVETNLEKKSVSLTLQSEYTDADIRYALNDSRLEDTPVKYMDPIVLDQTTIVKASIFKENKPIGKVFQDTIVFHKGVASTVAYTIPYSDRYTGTGKSTLVNTLRGTKNFQDGQWQAWLKDDMEIIIDLKKEDTINQVIVGSMEHQGPGIYFPVAIEVFTGIDRKDFKKVGEVKRSYADNATIELKDFKVNVEEHTARFIKVKIRNLKENPRGGDTWLFVDEILIN
ncbi:hexosaminidase [Aquimarina sp. EL_43]|uniref:glycoside hydrolase family 20 protein n=1 Tax=unclassified Aquimarina TaxID=2627091 RepID=UPI001A2D1BDA|nr:family 20 glycosylhydrolase [Aquimarina sp. EL_35]MBG6130311.1 hexosaminidase [Aquimarina sp. EL_35]MBG6149091.1 hexosaminidase [Aquimarina sp. EL_32]MBG6168535.1 hexosaminidase [Aquimarina sp. EL_43]